MKVVRIDAGAGPALMADSACRPDRRMPLFVPDGSWSIEIRPALRVGRLGKAMAPQFAPRHIDGWTLVAYLRPAAPSVLADMIDDGLCTGLWQSVDNATDAPLPVKIDGTTTPVNLRRLLARGAAELSDLSAAATFKTGDVIVLPDVLATAPAVAPAHILATLGQISILDIAIR